ncbi:hypothetical protein B0H19DRAFT_1310443 [Mycena capillaripes]|nr:hypothetical protein B0H19DRAFT_1310443 [Mycena capillaripes]
MSTKPSLLIIGPGLIGGSLLTEFLKTDQYALTVMARSAEQIEVLSKLGVKTIQAGVQDLETIASAIEAHDARTMLRWLRPQLKLSKEIHTTLPGVCDSVQRSNLYSAGVFGHLFSLHNPIETIYDDNDLAIINSLSPNAPHRAIDLAWYNASQELAGKVKIAILIPATIFGTGTGPFKKISIQLPIKIQAALRDGYASYGRDGQATFAHISLPDLVSASTILLDALQSDKVDVTKNPYFNASNSVEGNWLDVAKRIGSELYAKGKISSPEPKSSGPKYDFYGVYRPRSTRLRELGWKETNVDVLGGIPADVEALLSA